MAKSPIARPTTNKRRTKKPARRDAIAKNAAPKKSRPAEWRTKTRGGVTVLATPALQPLSWAVHGFSARKGGASRPVASQNACDHALNLGFTEWDSPDAVEANRRAFQHALGAEKMTLVTLRQIHSDVIHVVTAAPENTLAGDALVTSTPGLLLAVQTADCVPILLADTKHRAVAAVHAGWRGAAARIVAKAIGRMSMEFGTEPLDIVAALGPCIAQCSYEVGPDVAAAFAGQFAEARKWFDVPRGMNPEQFVAGEEPNPLKWLNMTPPGHDPPPPRVCLDLIAANHWQLRDAGVPDSAISASGLCTFCRDDLFFSYRREGARAGRMLSAIGIRP
jgi:polyphenol oxidase